MTNNFEKQLEVLKQNQLDIVTVIEELMTLIDRNLKQGNGKTIGIGKARVIIERIKRR